MESLRMPDWCATNVLANSMICALFKEDLSISLAPAPSWSSYLPLRKLKEFIKLFLNLSQSSTFANYCVLLAVEDEAWYRAITWMSYSRFISDTKVLGVARMKSIANLSIYLCLYGGYIFATMSKIVILSCHISFGYSVSAPYLDKSSSSFMSFATHVAYCM